MICPRSFPASWGLPVGLLVPLLAGCVASETERPMLAASPSEAARKVALTPTMRLGIAKAIEGTHPLTRLLENKVLVAEISAAKYDKSEIDRMSYRGYYCVRLTIERPLLDYRGVFAVYPTVLPDGQYEYRVRWRENRGVADCSPDHELNAFPELRAIYEGRTSAAL